MVSHHTPAGGPGAGAPEVRLLKRLLWISLYSLITVAGLRGLATSPVASAHPDEPQLNTPQRPLVDHDHEVHDIVLDPELGQAVSAVGVAARLNVREALASLGLASHGRWSHLCRSR